MSAIAIKTSYVDLMNTDVKQGETFEHSIEEEALRQLAFNAASDYVQQVISEVVVELIPEDQVGEDLINILWDLTEGTSGRIGRESLADWLTRWCEADGNLRRES